jgi:1-acyl-sn-glycerol-3-phosphate acyltransferase
MIYSLIQFFARLISKLTVRLEVDGFDKVPLTGGCILVGNHLGRMEVFLMYAITPRRDIILIIAEKYHKYAIFRWLAKQVNGIWVDRFNADLHAVRAVLARLKAGDVLAVAPEGTRSKSGVMQAAQPGAAFFAAKSGLPVIPIGISGTEDQIVSNNLKHLRRSHVQAWVGDPFYLPELPADKVEREKALEGYTDEIMCQIAALLPEKYWGIYADHPRLKELLAQPQSA